MGRLFPVANSAARFACSATARELLISQSITSPSRRWQRLRYSCRVLHDLEYACRGLLRAPGFTAVAVLTLALGIAGNTTVVSLARAVFSNPLPYHNADRLVALSERRAGSRNANIPVSGHEYVAWKQENQVFDDVAMYRYEGLNITGSGEPEAIQAIRTSPNYLTVLGLQPAIGRGFSDDDAAGPERVAILSDRFWRHRFGGDATVVGKTITLNDQAFSVVGILGPLPASVSPDLLLPIDVADEARAVGRHNLFVVARLHEGVPLDRARTDVSGISERLAARMPNDNTGHAAVVETLRESMVGEFRGASWLMIAAVGFVLLIGCGNVANLLLARGTNRQREIAIRTALGARRTRVVRQFVIESVVLASLGGALGLLIAAWVLDLATTVTALSIPLLETARLGWPGLGFAAAISLFTGLAAGLVPALRSSSVSPGWLREGNRMSDDSGRQRLRGALVAAEVALTLILLIGAGLMVNSFLHLVAVNPGFTSSGVLIVPLDLPPSRYPEAHQRRAFYDRVIEAVATTAGVESAGVISHLPLGGADNWMAFRIEGRRAPAAGQEPYAPFRIASPNYFTALGIPLKRGRLFNAGDARLAIPIVRWYPQQPPPAGFDKPQPPAVALVSESAARQFWPGEDPIGKRVRVLFSPNVTVVGIVGDVKHNGLNLPSYPHIYLSHNQEPWNSVSLVVKTTGAPAAIAPAIRQRIRSIDPSLPLSVKTMDDVLDTSIGRPRLYALASSLFGIVALGLSVVGIFGVVSYVAAQRTREIGVRMALGAQPAEILRLVVGQGMRPIGAGVAAGILGALALTRYTSNLLFGVAPLDPLTFFVVIATVVAVGLLACWIPARRATEVDPLTALRVE
jgi:putative ABC transport system permease protein